MKSPVLFLIFNRPNTTAKVFAAIREAKPPKLYIAADGPRPQRCSDAAECSNTRAIVANIDWECDVHRFYRDTNAGCKKGVSEGINWFFLNEEEGIILEDDVVPHPDFFPYCDHVLNKYRDDERVMMATGTNYLSNPDAVEPYFFSQHFSIWGWATWRRAWKYYDVNMKAWDSDNVKGNIEYIFGGGYISKHFSNTFDSLASTYIDTWDIQWLFACIHNSGLCVTPKVNLIANIGVEGTHSDSLTDSHFLVVYSLSLNEADKLNLPVSVNSKYDKSLHELKSRKGVRRVAAINFLKYIGLYKVVRFIKRKISQK